MDAELISRYFGSGAGARLTPLSQDDCPRAASSRSSGLPWMRCGSALISPLPAQHARRSARGCAIASGTSSVGDPSMLDNLC